MSEDVVRNIMMKMSLKTCDLDPVPTALLLNCTDDVLPALTNVISSLPTATVPKYLKKVIINPLLKKQSISAEFDASLCFFHLDENNR